jgi:hypothetical protein
MKWKVFGWQGFICRAPADWELASQRGNLQKGYFRLNDSTMPRMEVKWERKRKPPELPDMERAYRSGLRKAKHLEALPVQEGATGAGPAGSWQRFRWQGKVVFDDALLSCHTSRRAVVIRIFSPSRQRGEEAMRGVLTRFRDKLPSSSTLWTAYGFACEIPAGFQLEKCDLRAGFLMFRFRRGRHQLEFQRLRLGTVPESQKGLEHWNQRVLGKGWITGDSPAYSNHECKHSILVRTFGLSRLRKPLLKPMRHARLWRCGDADSLYLVKQSRTLPAAEKEWRVWCHEEPDGDLGEGVL